MVIALHTARASPTWCCPPYFDLTFLLFTHATYDDSVRYCEGESYMAIPPRAVLSVDLKQMSSSSWTLTLDVCVSSAAADVLCKSSTANRVALSICAHFMGWGKIRFMCSLPLSPSIGCPEAAPLAYNGLGALPEMSHSSFDVSINAFAGFPSMFARFAWV